MSGRGGGGGNNNNGKGNSGISGIPVAWRKIVQELKEIVNCPEAEIYAMLKDCNMDPNEAVNRLLSQDPFHEVKSKREKKKENKETTDPRSRGVNSITHRGGRGNADRYGRGGSSQFGYDETGVPHGKPTYKKENGPQSYVGSSSVPGVAGNNINRRPPMQSDSMTIENKVSTVGGEDGASLSLQPSSGFQTAWVGVPGQVSMADIVKMGRPQNKASVVPPLHSVNHHHDLAPPLAASHHDLHSSKKHASKVSDINAEPEVGTHHVHSIDEWPSIEKSPAANVSSVLEAPADSELYTDPSGLPLNRGNQQLKSHFDDVQSEENGSVEILNEDHVGPASVSSRNIPEDGSGGSSLFDSNLYGNMSTYQPHRHAFEHDEAEDGCSSVAANLQQLSLQNDDQEARAEDDNPSVIIPNHLQVHAQDCSHLSFGSFGAGIGSAFSGSFASRPLQNNLEETSEVDVPSAAHSDSRSPDYYEDEHIRSTVDENLVHRAGLSTGDYSSPSVPQPEVLKEETPEIAQGNEYSFSSAPGYTYEDTQQLNAALNIQQTSSQMQNISPFANVMLQQAYSNSLPNSLLASTVQSGREPDLSYLPFPVTQSMPTKYSNTGPSITGPSISMPEALRTGSVSTQQPPSQTLPSANVATGPALPQHLPMHPYSQPTLPLGHFANMIGYPLLPQGYTYMPSAFQQTFAGNNTYPQSLAALLPQYKNSVSVTSLPQSAAVASGYGFGSSTSIPAGSFPLNPPTAAAGTTIGYDDVLSSQYKDGNHLISLQQNDNSAMWVHGPGSRSMNAVAASTYYSFQGQDQQPGGFRQGQQPSQHLGALGYPNYYHSQTGLSLEHQQQHTRDGSLGGAQGQPSKQTQQLWQNTY